MIDGSTGSTQPMSKAVDSAFDAWYTRYHRSEQCTFNREAKRHIYDAFVSGFNAGEIAGLKLGNTIIEEEMKKI